MYIQYIRLETNALIINFFIQVSLYSFQKSHREHFWESILDYLLFLLIQSILIIFKFSFQRKIETSNNKPEMFYWRQAGLNYVQFSNIAAKVVRRSLQDAAKKDAIKREEAVARINKWQDGKMQQAAQKQKTNTHRSHSSIR